MSAHRVGIIVKEEDVTIPRLPRPPARIPADADSGTLTIRMTPHAEAREQSLDQRVAREPFANSGTVAGRERRGVLESGLVLWARINALIVLTITTLTALIGRAAFGTAGAWPIPWAEGLLFVYLAGTSVALSRLRLDARKLQFADAISTVAAGLGFALMLLTRPDRHETGELLFGVTMAHLLMIRAGVVPSSGQRTLWIGALAVIPGILVCMVGRVSSNLPTWAALALMVAHCSATIIASAIASRRIYGLEKQVAKALRLGQYTLQERVGTGGMGIVFKASHALLRRPTAIKLMRPEEEADESTLLQFEREAQLTSQLTHPSTIQIYDFGRNESGVFYYAMEFLEGLTLHELLELCGPQPVSRVITLLLQVCGSLAEAHGIGLVHRDIKPANIMVCERGRIADVVKVLDFGLAKMRGQPQNPLEGHDGTIQGTPDFLAPEAIRHPETVDARSDIYAVGAVAYYLITGEYLFGERASRDVLLDQLNTPPVPISLRLGRRIPADVEQVIASCLAKDPGQRPQTADELGARLLACADGRGWSQVQARAWWLSNRELVRRQVQDRSTAVNASFVARSPAKSPKRAVAVRSGPAP